MKWLVSMKNADFEAIAAKYNIDRVLARIIRNREVIEDADIDSFLNGGMDKLHSPFLLKDMGKAADIIKEKIKANKPIRIIGDYDVDGICATYILLKGIKTLGGNVDTVIPHRILDGYGLNENLINEAHEDGIDTIVTCDNGISAINQIDLANSYSMTVVVTDHHEVPYEMDGDNKIYTLPRACAVVDPKQEDCPYPYKGICGAFVAWKLVSVLLEGKHDEVLSELIPFAAMATVCDVMELLDENRIIVKEGLRLLENPVNIGMKALITATGLGEKTINAYHFGFVLGPTINATGRLDTARRALELFDSEDFNEACQIATQLRELNEERKKLTEEAAQMVSDMIENSEMKNDKIIVAYLEDCHESIAGIVAGRVKEKYYKPAIVITNAEDGVKGSGRSIEAYNMFEELTKVKDLFTKYGGHKMAAGLSLAKASDIEELRRRLNEGCNLTDSDMERVVHVDVPMPLSYGTLSLAKSFDLLEPCGVANPKPVFADKNISLLSYTKRGSNRVIGKFRACDEANRRFEIICFEDMDNFDTFIIDNFGQDKFNNLINGRAQKGDVIIKMVYSLGVNVYNGHESLQIVMKYYDV